LSGLFLILAGLLTLIGIPLLFFFPIGTVIGVILNLCAVGLFKLSEGIDENQTHRSKVRYEKFDKLRMDDPIGRETLLQSKKMYSSHSSHRSHKDWLIDQVKYLEEGYFGNTSNYVKEDKAKEVLSTTQKYILVCEYVGRKAIPELIEDREKSLQKIADHNKEKHQKITDSIQLAKRTIEMGVNAGNERQLIIETVANELRTMGLHQVSVVRAHGVWHLKPILDSYSPQIEEEYSIEFSESGIID
jgi:hypothetical protein